MAFAVHVIRTYCSCGRVTEDHETLEIDGPIGHVEHGSTSFRHGYCDVHSLEDIEEYETAIRKAREQYQEWKEAERARIAAMTPEEKTAEEEREKKQRRDMALHNYWELAKALGSLSLLIIMPIAICIAICYVIQFLEGTSP